MKNSKIIVTGGLGFLGQHIVKELFNAFPGKEILILAKTERKLRVFDKIPKNIKIISNIKLEEVDKIPEIFGEGDILVHNASLISYKNAQREEIFASNYHATKKLLQIAVKKHIKKFIFISSISAVGLNKWGETDESFYPDKNAIKNDHYALSKLMAEEEVVQYGGKLDYIILNPSVILGPGSEYVSKLIKLVSTLPIIPNVRAMNSFVDVRDVARAVRLAITSNISGERFIVTSSNINTEKLIRKISRESKKQPLIINIPAFFIYFLEYITKCLSGLGLYPYTKKPISFLTNKSYSAAKLRKTFGWKPRYSLEATISDSIKHSIYETGK